MAIFVTKVINSTPKFSDRPGAHARHSPDGLRAIIEFTGSREDYANAKSDPDTMELTRREAWALGRDWDKQLRGTP